MTPAIACTVLETSCSLKEIRHKRRHRIWILSYKTPQKGKSRLRLGIATWNLQLGTIFLGWWKWSKVGWSWWLYDSIKKPSNVMLWWVGFMVCKPHISKALRSHTLANRNLVGNPRGRRLSRTATLFLMELRHGNCESITNPQNLALFVGHGSLSTASQPARDGFHITLILHPDGEPGGMERWVIGECAGISLPWQLGCRMAFELSPGHSTQCGREKRLQTRIRRMGSWGRSSVGKGSSLKNSFPMLSACVLDTVLQEGVKLERNTFCWKGSAESAHSHFCDFCDDNLMFF